MALLINKRVSLIRLLSKQSSFTCKASVNRLNEIKTHQILFPEKYVRYTSTTAKKGNFISYTDLHDNGNLENSAHRKLDLSFNDSEAAFKAKSNFELLRGYFVFQLCGINFILDNQKMLLDASRTILGRNLFNKLMKSTFYGHFVAGENEHDIKDNVVSMQKYGVKSILDYSAEEDLENNHVKKSQNLENFSKNRKLYEQDEIQSEKNLTIFLNCLNTVKNVTDSTGLAAIKITSLIRPELLLKFSSLIDQTISFEKKNPGKKIDNFKVKNLLTMNDEQLLENFNEIKELMENTDMITFTPNEVGEIKNMFMRLDELSQLAMKNKVKMFVDAEQTYFQAAIRRIVMELMREYNKNQCTVMNTYQNYLKNAYDTLVEDLELSKKEGFRFGAKLVRGAYMEQERERAMKMGYEDPVNESYDATTQMYERSFIYCLDQIKNNPGFVNIMVASHNEDTVRFAVQKMDDCGINPKDESVFFGQLYGMCDFITFYLGGVGYSAYKYVPYGPVDEVLPYLSRRATENGRGVFEKIDKEKRLVKSEIKRRFLNLDFF